MGILIQTKRNPHHNGANLAKLCFPQGFGGGEYGYKT
jgi:hypothetical protein